MESQKKKNDEEEHQNIEKNFKLSKNNSNTIIEKRIRLFSDMSIGIPRSSGNVKIEKVNLLDFFN